MAINFPSSPSLNDTHTHGNMTWKWNGSSWESLGVGVSGFSGAFSALTGRPSTRAGYGITDAISGLVDDTTPQLGGTLDANGQTIDMGTNVITDAKVGQWDTAYGWGDHSLAGYLTAETSHADVLVDGDFGSAGIMATDGAGTYSIITDNSSNWNTAYGWGDHSLAGYLTDLTGSSLTSLSNVDAAGAGQDGYVLYYDHGTTSFKWKVDASGGGSLSALSDVYASLTPSDGQVLYYDNANSRWDSALVTDLLNTISVQNITGDGATSSFAITETPVSADALFVTINGLVQEPGIAYSVTGSAPNEQINFTFVPDNLDQIQIRSIFAAASSGTIPGHIIQNNASTLTDRDILNFDGTYITATDNSGNNRNDITVSSALQTWHSTTNNASNWNTAYGWGDHSAAGYSSFSGSYTDLTNIPTVTRQNETGDGSTKSWNITDSPATEDSLIVTVNGIVQEAGDAYTVAGTSPSVITFSYAPILGEDIQIRNLYAGSFSANLTSLNDVYTSMSPGSGQVLTWDSANSRWDASTITSVMSGATLQSETGDGSTTTWALDNTATTNTLFVTVNGLVQEAGVAYNVSGSNIVFTYAPLSGETIQIRNLYSSGSGSAGISDLVQDTTPQLGGTLDANGYNISMGTYTITDAKVNIWDTATTLPGLTDVYSSMSPTNGQVLAWDAGNSRWDAATNSAATVLVDDTSPQLGGNLDANGFYIDMGVNNITDTQVGQWDTAYGWGNHGVEGYITASSTDTLTNKSGNISQWTNDSGYLTAETDPVFSAHTTSNIVNGTGFLKNNGSGTWSYDNNTYLTAETNDLTSAVTWANVPNANITQSSVTQHQAALQITESQITDLAHYADSDVDAHLNQSNPTAGFVLSWSGTDYAWVSNAGYTDSDVDAHLNQSNPTSGYVLSWNGSDYAWVSNAGYTDSDVDAHLNQSNPTAGYVLSWNGSDYAWVDNSTGVVEQDEFTGDGSTTTYTLSSSSTTDALLVSMNGIIQEGGPGAAYTVSGTTLTFAIAPASTDRIITKNLLTVTDPYKIEDGDNDTKVEVEASADEDKIRFTTAGTERALIDSSGLTLGTGLTAYTFPTADGNADQVLATNGSGTVSFTNPGRVIKTTHAIQSYSGNMRSETYVDTGFSITHNKISSTSTLYVLVHGSQHLYSSWGSLGCSNMYGYIRLADTSGTIITGTTDNIQIADMRDQVPSGCATVEIGNVFSWTFKVTSANCPDGTTGNNTFDIWSKINNASDGGLAFSHGIMMVTEVEE